MSGVLKVGTPFSKNCLCTTQSEFSSSIRDVPKVTNPMYCKYKIVWGTTIDFNNFQVNIFWDEELGLFFFGLGLYKICHQLRNRTCGIVLGLNYLVVYRIEQMK